MGQLTVGSNPTVSAVVISHGIRPLEPRVRGFVVAGSVLGTNARRSRTGVNTVASTTRLPNALLRQDVRNQRPLTSPLALPGVWGSAPLVAASLSGAIRVIYILCITPHYRPMSDADQYLDIARNIARGNGIAMQWPQLEVHATAFRPPLYPLLLSGWIWLAGDAPGTARWLNVGLGILNAVLCTALGRRLAGRNGALFVGIGYAIYLPFVANDTSTLAETLAITLTMLLLVAISERRYLLVGLAGGLLMLTKPAAQGLVVLLVVVLAAGAWRSARDASIRGRLVAVLATAGVTALAAVTIVAPWLVRNRDALGDATLVTSNGFNVTAIYGERARSVGGFVDPVYDPENQSLGERLLRFDEARWNRELTDRGLDGLRSDPAYVVRVVWRNLGGWFELTPWVNDVPELLDGRDPRLRLASRIQFGVLLLLGTAGLIETVRRSGRGRRTAAFAVVIGTYFTLTSLLFVAVPRLRSGFDLVLLLGAAGWLGVHIQPRRRGAPSDD